MGKEIEAIKGIVHAINECWRLKDYEGIGTYLRDDVVIAPPQSAKRIRGIEAYVKSYQDYDRLAETLVYTPADPKVDIMGDTAVAICPFEVKYRLQGEKHHEKGQNILVLTLAGGDWKVSWRTMTVEAIPDKFD